MLDVILLGATGFAGRNVLRELLKDDRLRVGMAARDVALLRSLSQTLCPRRIRKEDVFDLDLRDPEALRTIVARARCVLNCVGPYMDLGEPVLRACIASGTHCVDLSGETEWIADMHALLHADARASGVCLVSACGFDSIPADALACRLIKCAASEMDLSDAHATLEQLVFMGRRKSLWGSAGGLGHGTWETILRGWHTRRGIDKVIDPAPLPEGSRARLAGGTGVLRRFQERAMGGPLWGVRSELFSDAYVVRRSAMGHFRTFELAHFFAAPNWFVAASVAVFLWLMPKLLRFSFVYRALARLARPGEGVLDWRRDNGRATVHARLRVFDGGDNDKPLLEKLGVASVEMDPNDASAALALRCAAALATGDRRKSVVGCVTPAVAFNLERIVDGIVYML